MIGIINYQMGNLTSVLNAFQAIGAEARILNSPTDLDGCEKVVLPGVGAFAQAMANLGNKGWLDPLRRMVIEQGRPFLGICLGMQLLAETGDEFGPHPGLGWLPGRVVKLIPSNPALRVPHIGWNDVSYPHPSPFYCGIPERTDFYFVHSFQFLPTQPAHVSGLADYGGPVTASVTKDNLFAVQFHPEKSGRAGLRLLGNFANV
jgi:glutamine amidotransferase